MHRHSVLASLLAAVAAQHTQDPKLCVIGSPVTTFKDCHALDSYIESCGKYASTSDATKYYNCYCQQDYVNAIYGCQNEERLCLANPVLDTDFSSAASTWSSVCTPIINYKPTMPMISSITQTVYTSECISAISACKDMSISRYLCYDAYTSGQDTTSVSSCLCASSVLSLEYQCSFVGNVSCLRVPANTMHMSGYTYCQEASSIWASLQTLPMSSNSTITIRFSESASTATSTSSPVMPASTVTTPGPVQTSTQSAAASSDRLAALSRLLDHSYSLALIILCFGLGVTL